MRKVSSHIFSFIKYKNFSDLIFNVQLIFLKSLTCLGTNFVNELDIYIKFSLMFSYARFTCYMEAAELK